jgi:hypothetical protein
MLGNDCNSSTDALKIFHLLDFCDDPALKIIESGLAKLRLHLELIRSTVRAR